MNYIRSYHVSLALALLAGALTAGPAGACPPCDMSSGGMSGGSDNWGGGGGGLDVGFGVGVAVGAIGALTTNRVLQGDDSKILQGEINRANKEQQAKAVKLQMAKREWDRIQVRLFRARQEKNDKEVARLIALADEKLAEMDRLNMPGSVR